MIVIGYDSETTGLPLWGEPSDDPRQPHIVELAAILVDTTTFEELARLHAIIKPDGWTIPADVAAIHGITTERALAEGRPAKAVYLEFLTLWRQAEKRIAHNESFDARMMRIAMFRHFDEAHAEECANGKAECTQALSTPILKLPPTPRMRAVGRFHHKSANLTEAHQHFMGCGFEGAHGALADALACMSVWRAIKALGPQPPRTAPSKARRVDHDREPNPIDGLGGPF